MGSRVRKDVKHFFECFCEVVGPKSDQDAWIIQKYPECYKEESVLKSVPQFAFPCEFDKSVAQNFSFVLTDIDSKYTFGFCRHNPKFETAFVILTYLPWNEVFIKFLNDISQIMQGARSDSLWKFLEIIYESEIPSIGCNLEVLNHPSSQVFTYEAPSEYKLPSIPESRNLTEYYSAVDRQNMIVIFASMLSERRIIFTSKKLSRLSSCVLSANTLLYPMSWQHIFIPVLPKCLVDYLLAPMPYLIGLPHALTTYLKKNDLGDVVIFDADNNSVQTPFKDVENLPADVVHNLQKHLRNQDNLLGDGVSRAFLRAIVQLIGGYRDALKISQGKKITFNEEAFVESRPLSIQPFLRQMLEFQIFRQFIEERLELLNTGRGFSDEFEVEVCKYSEKATKLQQYKEWASTKKREGSAIFKHVKQKARAHGRDVTSAIRSKLKDKKRKPSSAPSSPTNVRKFTTSESPSNSSSFRIDEETQSQYDLLEDSSSGTNNFPQRSLSPLDMDLMNDLRDMIYRNSHVKFTNLNTEETEILGRSELPYDSTSEYGSESDLNVAKTSISTSHLISTDDSKATPCLPSKTLPTTDKEPTRKEVVSDLIRLDSSSSSYGDIDFDPLTNGECFIDTPIAVTNDISVTRSNIVRNQVNNWPPSSNVTFPNPLYPHGSIKRTIVPPPPRPQQQSLSAMSSCSQKDSDLLNEYGINFNKLQLRQLPYNKSSLSNTSYDSSPTVARSKSEWTKFE